MWRHVVFSTAHKQTLPCYSTSSPGCKSCRIMRMSGHSCVCEQGSRVEGSGELPGTAGVSFRTGKKVKQSCPPSSVSSLASAPTSTRILGSVTNQTHLFTEFTSNTHILVGVNLKRSTLFLTCVTIGFILVLLTCASP